MVQMLNHNELLFRAAASHFLNMAFENRIGYRPDANRLERRRAILQWEQMIRVHYRIQQNAARQSNAANNRNAAGANKNQRNN